MSIDEGTLYMEHGDLIERTGTVCNLNLGGLFVCFLCSSSPSNSSDLKTSQVTVGF